MALDYEESYYLKGLDYIVGLDEAGRGPLLGPVVCAAVILPKNFKSDLINDSKKLSEKKRNEAYKIIIENALDYTIEIIDVETIDRINILEASRLGMSNALKRIKHQIDVVLTDYMKLDVPKNVIFESLIKGDSKAQCIAAASILAKVTRDNLMYELDKLYPQYHIKSHKGYGTKLHLEALQEYGIIKGVHRLTFGPVKKYIFKKVKLF